MCTRVLHPQDKFIIFASDGLWEHLTNQEAVEIVHSSPRRVCLWYLHLHVHEAILFSCWSLFKGLSGNGLVLYIRKILSLIFIILIGNCKETSKSSIETSRAEEGNEV